MSYRKYTFNIIYRIILLSGAMLVFFYAMNQDKWYVTTSVSGLLVPVFIYSLVHYTHRFRGEISNFLLAIKHREYSQYRKSDIKNRKNSLEYAFYTIADELQNVTIEKESHYHYLRAIVENINIGIISYRTDGKIHLFNKSASRLLKMPVVNHFDILRKYNPSLYEAMGQMKPGERRLFTLHADQEVFKIAIQSRKFKQRGESFKLFSLQDIRSELEEQEVQSYQKLIQVLRHEIMNSATPISSLSEAVNESLQELLEREKNLNPEFKEELQDLIISTDTIYTRTKGLLHFVQNYRKLTNIPKPTFDKVDLEEVINHSVRLLKSKLEEKNIQVQVELTQDFPTISGDFDQLEQVVLNVLLNAIEAIQRKENGLIHIKGYLDNDGGVKVSIADNGAGIREEDREKLFIPFFTTKKSGSGIGLSLARQILKLHHANIQIFQGKESGVVIELSF